MKVKTNKGHEIELSADEAKFLKAIKRLEKMEQGRLMLFGNGKLSVRWGGFSYHREIYHTSIICEGGDGGDDFD